MSWETWVQIWVLSLTDHVAMGKTLFPCACSCYKSKTGEEYLPPWDVERPECGPWSTYRIWELALNSQLGSKGVRWDHPPVGEPRHWHQFLLLPLFHVPIFLSSISPGFLPLRVITPCSPLRVLPPAWPPCVWLFHFPHGPQVALPEEHTWPGHFRARVLSVSQPVPESHSH